MRLFLIGIVVTVTILVLAMPRFFHEQQLAAHEARTEGELQRFRREEAFRVPGGTGDKAVFSIPVKSFYYAGGFTYGQLKKDLAERALEAIAGLERSVSFIEYIQYIARTFVRGTRYTGEVSSKKSRERQAPWRLHGGER